MADELAAIGRDEDVAEREVPGDRVLRVVGDQEQRQELRAVPGVELDLGRRAGAQRGVHEALQARLRPALEREQRLVRIAVEAEDAGERRLRLLARALELRTASRRFRELQILSSDFNFWIGSRKKIAIGSGLSVLLAEWEEMRNVT